MAVAIHEIVPHSAPGRGARPPPTCASRKNHARVIGRKHDNLVSTTIIENGIESERQHDHHQPPRRRHGPAQLYQLRGRVGRDVPRRTPIWSCRGPGDHAEAVRRLEALENSPSWASASNWRCANGDRGTGSLLGSEQHGAIADIGFEMYSKCSRKR